MITVKIFGTEPPCVKCRKTEEVARKVGERFPGRVMVEKHLALSEEGDKYGVMLTPTVVINDKVVAVGKVPTESNFEKFYQQELEG